MTYWNILEGKKLICYRFWITFKQIMIAMDQAELATYAKRSYSAANLHTDLPYPLAYKRTQLSSPSCSEMTVVELTMNVEETIDEEECGRSVPMCDVEATNTNVFNAYAFNLLKCSDIIARRMMFHDMICFRVGREKSINLRTKT